MRCTTQAGSDLKYLDGAVLLTGYFGEDALEKGDKQLGGGHRHGGVGVKVLQEVFVLAKQKPDWVGLTSEALCKPRAGDVGSTKRSTSTSSTRHSNQGKALMSGMSS